MKLRFQIQHANGSISSWEHGGPTIRIGRDPSCQLKFPEDTAAYTSSKHAQIELTPNGARLSDTNSTNGTYVNDKRVEGGVILKVGDLIALGRWGPKLQVETIEVAPAVAPRADSRRDHGPDTGKGRGRSYSDEETSRPPVDSAASPFGYARSPSPSNPNLSPHSASSAANSSAEMISAIDPDQGYRWIIGGSCVAVTAVLGLCVMLALPRKEGGQIQIPQITPTSHAMAPTQIYDRTLRSAAWVVSLQPTPLPGVNLPVGTGSGSVVDRKRMLVLTNNHVVEDRKVVEVYFARRDGSNEVVTDRALYLAAANKSRFGSQGTVIARDTKRDLALIKLIDLPPEVEALSLAETSATPGVKVFTVGNPGASGALWAFTSGDVRSVHPSEYFDGTWIIETSSPINSGDSGGPVVDDRCRLVAVNTAVKTKASLVTLCIDVREVRDFLSKSVPHY